MTYLFVDGAIDHWVRNFWEISCTSNTWRMEYRVSFFY